MVMVKIGKNVFVQAGRYYGAICETGVDNSAGHHFFQGYPRYILKSLLDR